MKLVKWTVLLLAFWVTQPLHAALDWDFSYTFGDGTTVTGSFEGTQNGSVVEDITNVKMSINGIPMSFDFLTYQRNGDWRLYPGGIVSLDLTQQPNNFKFHNGGMATFLDFSDWQVYVYHESPDGNIFAYDSPPSSGRWSVTPAVVPEPSTYIAGAVLLLPFGLSGIRMLRKKTHTA